MSGPGDPYARVDYRRLVAWEARIRREGPFLERLLAVAPDRSVLDVGCGTGEHVAFFAGIGARAVGLDSSASMVEAARAHEREGRGRLRFVLGDAREAPALLAGESPFGLAVCLGNVLPHVEGEADLERFFRALAAVLLPGGLLLLQILNDTRIREQGIRHLPLNLRPGDDGKEIVFLRLLLPQEGGRVLFFPTTLELDPASDEPVAVKASRRVLLRAWEAKEVEAALAAAGFGDVRRHGDLEEGPFDPTASTDLVLVARRG